MQKYACFIDELFDLPPQMDFLKSPIEEIFSKIGVVDIKVTTGNAQGVSPLADPIYSVREDEIDDLFDEDEESPDDSSQTISLGCSETIDPAAMPVDNSIYSSGDFTISIFLKALTELNLEIFDIEGVKFIIDTGSFPIQVHFKGMAFEKVDLLIGFALRISADYLKPMLKTTDAQGNVKFEPDTESEYVQIDVGQVIFSIDKDKNLDIEAGIIFNLSRPVKIGNSPIILENLDMELNISGSGAKPAGAPDNWKGLFIHSAILSIPDIMPATFSVSNFGIGTGGLWGTAGIVFNPLISTEVFGLKLSLKEFSLSLQANRITNSLIAGQLGIPYFDDPDNPSSPVEFVANFTDDGEFKLGLASSNNAESLADMDIGPVNLGLYKMLFEKVNDGPSSLQMTLKLTIANDEGPEPYTFDIEDIKVYTNGRVEIPGGWYDMKDLLTYDKEGFKLAITKVGLGIDTSMGAESFVGFSGGLQLTGDLPVGAAVEGARFTWKKKDDGTYDYGFKIAGASLAFIIPDLLGLGIDMVFFERGDSIGPPGFDPDGRISGLAGEVFLSFFPLGFTVEGNFIVGHFHANPPEDMDDFFFWMIYLDAMLPTGITCGYVAFYGFAGLIAYQMAPNILDGEHFYRDWFRKKQPQVGAHYWQKWRPEEDAFAFGVGTTLGTSFDDGFTISAKAMFLASFPGPKLMLVGKANLLKDRAEINDPNTDPLFRFVVLYDHPERTFLFALEVTYKKEKILNINGLAEVFFSPADWHVYVGEKPDDKRIQAKILKLFTANSYLMIDQRMIAFGFFIGFKPNEKKFGPIRLKIEAYMDTEALISWQPELYSGNLTMVGKIDIRVAFIRLALSLYAMMEVSGPKPWHIEAEVEAVLDTPWPLPDLDAKIHLLWEQKIHPLISAPFSDYQFDAHTALGSSKTYKVYETLASANDPGSEQVPMDGVLSIIFNRLVGKAQGILSELPAQSGTSIIGEQGCRYELNYQITEASLEKVGTGEVNIIACWAPQRPEDQADHQKSILMLNTNNPFHVDRLINDSLWWENDLQWYGEYFCPDVVNAPQHCWSVDKSMNQSIIVDDYKGNGFRIEVDDVMVNLYPISDEEIAVQNSLNNLLYPGVSTFNSTNIEMKLFFDYEVACFDISGAYRGKLEYVIYSYDKIIVKDKINQTELNPFRLKADDLLGGLNTKPITGVILKADEIYLERICYILLSDRLTETFSTSQRGFIESLRENWQTDMPLFDPNSTYKLNLKVQGRINEISGSYGDTSNFTKTLYFKTGGPPDVLSPYVKHTIPADGASYFFRKYIIALDFKAQHVPLMYEKEGNKLFLYITTAGGSSLHDPEGTPILEPDGTPKRFNYSVVEHTHLLSQTEMRLSSLSNCGYAEALSSIDLPRTINFTPGAEVIYQLDPETRYCAYLASDSHKETSADGTERLKPLHSFSFVSSKYLDFPDLINSKLDCYTHDLGKLYDYTFSLIPPKILTSEERDEVYTLFSEHGFDEIKGNDFLLSPDRSIEDSAHNRLRELFALRPYQKTAGTEVFEIKDDISHYGFLLQFAEPLNWDRVSLSGSLIRMDQDGEALIEYPTSSFSIVRNFDNTSFFIQFTEAYKTITERVLVKLLFPKDPGWWRERVESPLQIGLRDKRVYNKIPRPRINPAFAQKEVLGKSSSVKIKKRKNALNSRGSGIFRTLFSIVPVIFKVTNVWIGLLFDRLFGWSWVTRESEELINDLEVPLLLKLDFTYTLDFTAELDADSVIAFLKNYPQITIQNKQGTDISEENTLLEALFQYQEGASDE